MQVLGEFRGFMGVQGQEALMLQIMQRSLGVTTSGHLSNRQVIRRSQPQFSIIRGVLHYVA
jgi:hypothetical protein